MSSPKKIRRIWNTKYLSVCLEHTENCRFETDSFLSQSFIHARRFGIPQSSVTGEAVIVNSFIFRTSAVLSDMVFH